MKSQFDRRFATNEAFSLQPTEPQEKITCQKKEKSAESDEPMDEENERSEESASQ